MILEFRALPRFTRDRSASMSKSRQFVRVLLRCLTRVINARDNFTVAPIIKINTGLLHKPFGGTRGSINRPETPIKSLKARRVVNTMYVIEFPKTVNL